MIPPFVFTKAAELLAPVAAKLTSPLVKWSIIGGIVVILLVVTNWKTYDYMRTKYEKEKVEFIARQANESAKTTLAGNDMTKTVVGNASQHEEQVREQIRYIDREVIKYVQKPSALKLDADTIALYEHARQLLTRPYNLPPADASSGKFDASRGGLPTTSSGVVQVPTEDGQIELTTDELVQAVVDSYEKCAVMQERYRGLTEWERGRYTVEKARVENP